MGEVLDTKHWVKPEDGNPNGNLFGGQTLAWLDENSAILSMKVTGYKCVTIKVHDVIFHKPIPIGSVINIRSKISRVGNTSLDVYSEITIDNLTNLINSTNIYVSGTFTMVAMNNGIPTSDWDHTLPHN